MKTLYWYRLPPQDCAWNCATNQMHPLYYYLVVERTRTCSVRFWEKFPGSAGSKYGCAEGWPISGVRFFWDVRKFDIDVRFLVMNTSSGGPKFDQCKFELRSSAFFGFVPWLLLQLERPNAVFQQAEERGLILRRRISVFLDLVNRAMRWLNQWFSSWHALFGPKIR